MWAERSGFYVDLLWSCPGSLVEIQLTVCGFHSCDRCAAGISHRNLTEFESLSLSLSLSLCVRFMCFMRVRVCECNVCVSVCMFVCVCV